eukprot:COSAG01_NODE_11043_length_2022_cov_1.841394_3_plen_155_part_00
MAKLSTVEALRTASAPGGALGIGVLRFGAVAREVTCHTAVPALGVRAAAAAANTAASDANTDVLRAVPLEMADLSADVAGAGGRRLGLRAVTLEVTHLTADVAHPDGLLAGVLRAVPLEVTDLTADMAYLVRHCRGCGGQGAWMGGSVTGVTVT